MISFPVASKMAYGGVHRALPPPKTALDMLDQQRLDQDKDMKRIASELYNYYQKISRQTFYIKWSTNPPRELPLYVQIIELIIALLKEEYPKPVTSVCDAVVLVESVVQHNWSMLNIIKNVFDTSKSRAKRTLSNLSSTLVNFSQNLEQIFLHYINKEWKVPMPSFESITTNIKSIFTCLRQVKVGEFEDKIPNFVSISHEDLLHGMLGLSLKSSFDLQSICEGTRGHQTRNYWIKQLLDENWQEIQNGQAGSGYTKDVFVEMGLTDSTAQWLLQALKSNPFRDHQTPDYWVQKYIQNIHDIILNTTTRYPYSEETGEWLDKHIENDEMEDSGVLSNDELIIRYINIPKTGVKCLTRDQNAYPPPSDEHFLMLCHGTDHKSATKIAESGIELNKGKEKQDFSNGYGFYLNPDFEDAALWAKCGRFKSHAVVVYKIPKAILERRSLDLRLDENRQRWVDVIRDNRSGKPRKKLKRDYGIYDYIAGPICTNPSKALQDYPKGQGRGSDQYCILSQNMAEDLDKYVDAIIFY